MTHAAEETLPKIAVGLTDQEAYPRPGRAWWTVGVFIVLSCISLIDRQILVLLVPEIRRDLALSDFQVGLLQGLAFSAFYVTFGLGFGWLIDRTSRRAVVFAGMTIWGFATCACGLAASSVQLALARFGVGAGEAALNPAAYSLLSDAFPKRRLSLALSVFSVGAHLGVGLSLLLGGWLIAHVPKAGLEVAPFGHLAAWRVVMLAAGAPALLFAFLIWTAVDPPRRGRLGRGGASAASVAAFMRRQWRFYAGHFIGFALLSASGYGYNTWAAVYLMRRFHLEVAQVVSILAPVAVIGGVGGVLLAGAVTDHLFARGIKDAPLRVFVVGALLQPVALLLAFGSSSLWAFAAWAGVASATLGYIGVAPAALQLVTPNEMRGQVSAGYQLVTSLLGSGLGPAMVGALATYAFRSDGMIGWAIVTHALIACPVAALALASSLRPMRAAIEAAEA